MRPPSPSPLDVGLCKCGLPFPLRDKKVCSYFIGPARTCFVSCRLVGIPQIPNGRYQWYPCFNKWQEKKPSPSFACSEKIPPCTASSQIFPHKTNKFSLTLHSHFFCDSLPVHVNYLHTLIYQVSYTYLQTFPTRRNLRGRQVNGSFKGPTCVRGSIRKASLTSSWCTEYYGSGRVLVNSILLKHYGSVRGGGGGDNCDRKFKFTRVSPWFSVSSSCL